MRFVPSQPDSQSPTWESVFGLFSFHVGAVIFSSLVIALIPGAYVLTVPMSETLTTLAAFLYACLAESQVPGALRQTRCRILLACRAAFVTCVIAVTPMVAFGLVQVKPSALSRSDLYMFAFLLGGLFVVPWLEMWIGLTLATWLKGRRLNRKG